MSFKKNAVSYGIWALYLMGIGVVLSFMGMVVALSYDVAFHQGC